MEPATEREARGQQSQRLQQAARELDEQLQQSQQLQIRRQQQNLMLRQQRAKNGEVVYDPNGSIIIPEPRVHSLQVASLMDRARLAAR